MREWRTDSFIGCEGRRFQNDPRVLRDQLSEGKTGEKVTSMSAAARDLSLLTSEVTDIRGDVPYEWADLQAKVKFRRAQGWKYKPGNCSSSGGVERPMC